MRFNILTASFLHSNRNKRAVISYKIKRLSFPLLPIPPCCMCRHICYRDSIHTRTKMADKFNVLAMFYLLDGFRRYLISRYLPKYIVRLNNDHDLSSIIARLQPTARDLRLTGRFGMGACQGRFCAEWVAHFSNTQDLGRPRLPLRPIPIADLLAVPTTDIGD